jgi:CubicO group peptidase (beta-lactamase class C family)
VRRSNRAAWVLSAATVVATVVLMAFLFWPRPITLSPDRSGDLALIQQVGTPEGHRRLAVTIVDLGARQPVRQAFFGADADTAFEAGSLTKAFTGLALADSVRRGEVNLDAPVRTYLDLGGTPAGEVTLRELATHRSGYPRLGGRTFWSGLLTNYTAGNPYGADRDDVLAEARATDLDGRGTYEYSNLGAAITGHAAASAAGLDYPTFLRERLLEPLRMDATSVPDRPVVPEGLTERGRASAPWVMDGYAPAGGVVTTTADLTRLAQAVLRGNAPGLAALRPVAEGSEPDRRVGLFWLTTPVGEQDTPVTWHNGRTGGYASFVGFDLERRRAVIVLSDVSRSVDELAVRLLTETM